MIGEPLGSTLTIDDHGISR